MDDEKNANRYFLKLHQIIDDVDNGEEGEYRRPGNELKWLTEYNRRCKEELGLNEDDAKLVYDMYSDAQEDDFIDAVIRKRSVLKDASLETKDAFGDIVDTMMESNALKTLLAAGIIAATPLSANAADKPPTDTVTQVQSVSRGFRNNNPGNIKKSKNKWKGLKGSDKSFVKFDTMENGIRAMVRILNNYQSKYNLKTIEQIITKWAPPEDNNPTEKYIKYVSKHAGIKRDQVVNFKVDEISQLHILEAIIQFENNNQTISAVNIIKSIRAEEK